MRELGAQPREPRRVARQLEEDVRKRGARRVSPGRQDDNDLVDNVGVVQRRDAARRAAGEEIGERYRCGARTDIIEGGKNDDDDGLRPKRLMKSVKAAIIAVC